MGVLFVVSFGDNRFCNLSWSHHESRTWPLSAALPRVRNKNWILLFKSRDEWIIFDYDISIHPFVDRSCELVSSLAWFHPYVAC